MILLIAVLLITNRKFSAVSYSRILSFKFLYCPKREGFEVIIPLDIYTTVRYTETGSI